MTDSILNIERDNGMWSSLPCWTWVKSSIPAKICCPWFQSLGADLSYSLLFKTVWDIDKPNIIFLTVFLGWELPSIDICLMKLRGSLTFKGKGKSVLLFWCPPAISLTLQVLHKSRNGSIWLVFWLIFSNPACLG